MLFCVDFNSMSLYGILRRKVSQLLGVALEFSTPGFLLGIVTEACP